MTLEVCKGIDGKGCGNEIRGSRSLPASAFELCAACRRGLNVRRRKRAQRTYEQATSKPLDLLSVTVMDADRQAVRRIRLDQEIIALVESLRASGYSTGEVSDALRRGIDKAIRS